MINISSDPSFINIIVDLDIYDRDFQNAINLLNSSGFEAINSQFYYYPKTLLLAKIYDLSGDKEKADQYYDQSRNLIESRLKSYPDDSRYYSSLGICYAGLDQKEQAIKHAEKAVELLPVSKEAFRGMYRLGDLAQIYVMVGENEQALETLDMLLSIPGVLSANLLQLDPTWKPLWDHPEFIRLIEKFAQ